MFYDKKPVTIEEYNRQAREAGVISISSEITPSWEPCGIICPCGCNQELLEKYPQPVSDKRYIKCKVTGKTGYLLFDGSAIGLITGIKWEKDNLSERR